MLKELLSHKATLEGEICNLKESIASIDEQIEQIIAHDIEQLRVLQGKEFGAVNLNVEGVKVTHTITKKVEWDQEKLAAIYDRIMIAGDNPLTYMRQKLDVTEKQYAEFPKPIRNIFDEARTVKSGKPTLKFETFE